MLVNIIGWTLLIASWTLPQKLFKSKEEQRDIRMLLAGAAVVIFVGGLLNLFFL